MRPVELNDGGGGGGAEAMDWNARAGCEDVLGWTCILGRPGGPIAVGGGRIRAGGRREEVGGRRKLGGSSERLDRLCGDRLRGRLDEVPSPDVRRVVLCNCR